MTSIDWSNLAQRKEYYRNEYIRTHPNAYQKPDIISEEVKAWLIKAKPYQRKAFFTMFDEHMQHLETLKSVDYHKYDAESCGFRSHKWDKAHFGFLGRIYAKRERKKAKKGNNGGVS
jgi:alpha-ketoglutarate-dependent taurine dioxygenase